MIEVLERFIVLEECIFFEGVVDDNGDCVWDSEDEEDSEVDDDDVV